MKIALLGAFPIMLFADQLGTKNPPKNTPSWNVNLAKGLAAISGNEVHFITINSCIRRDQVLTSDGAIVHFLSCPPKSRIITLFQYNKVKIHRELAKIDPDIVHGHGTEHEYPYIAVTSPFPAVVTIHNYMPLIIQESGWGLLFHRIVPLYFERYVLRNSRYIISTTPFLEEKVKQIASGKHFIVNNSVSPIFFQPKLRQKTQVLYVGYFRPEKNIECLVRAFSLIRSAFPEVRLKLVGSYARSNAAYFRQITSLVLQLGIMDRVDLPGYKRPQELVDELARSFFLVLPSSHEPFGVVLIEAMATGIPVIASRVGGMPWVVKDGETGFVVKPGDLDGLAETMLLLLENGKLRYKMGQRGKEEAMRRFHPEVVAKKTMAVYEEVLSDWNGSFSR